MIDVLTKSVLDPALVRLFDAVAGAVINMVRVVSELGARTMLGPGSEV